MLILYLVRLRHGISINKTVNIFPFLNEWTVYRQFKQLRTFLMENFVSRNLGINNVTRADVDSKYTNSLSKKLYNLEKDAIVTVWDGTCTFFDFFISFLVRAFHR